MPLTAPLVILGQLTAAAFACGLNLYLTVALIGLTSRLGLIPGLPPGLRGLEHAIVITSAIVLYIVEFVIDKIPHADSVWDAVHTLVRPIGAALLAFLALDSSPLHYQVGGAFLAGLIALAAHGTKAGLRLVLNTTPSKVRNTFISVLEDVCAAGLAVLALMYPVAALAGAGVAALLLLLLGPRLWRVAALGVRAFGARMRSFFGQRGWRTLEDVPPRLRALVPPLELGRGEPRTLRAGVKGVPGVAAYRSGWIVLGYDSASFVYRARFRSRTSALPRLHDPVVRRGLWTDAIEFQIDNRTATIFLLKDGPAADVAAAGLREVR